MDTIKINKRNTLMVAHRGLSGLERENTCAAFIAAGNRDYFGIETDVRRAGDNSLVLLHDGSTKRVSSTLIDVKELSLDEIRAVELNELSGEPAAHLRIPTLEEYLYICEKYEKKCVLEFKNNFPNEDLERILEAVNKYTSLENMVFISFHYDVLARLRGICPKARIQFLCECEVNDELVNKLKDYSMELDINHNCLTKENIKFLHDNGIVVNCWTVNDPQRGEDLCEWGVDIITTNILQ